MTQAPPALVRLTTAYKARPDRAHSYVMDGIVGDASHAAEAKVSGTYHMSARDCGFKYGHLYSLNTARDIAGGKAHPDYASAWDLGLNPADMKLLTGRLLTAAKAKDPRLNAVAEFAGTTNGTTVHAFYVNTGKDDPNNTGGWDHSHTTHIHLSISRDDCDNYDALAPILDVLCGVPLETEFTMDDEAKKAFADLHARLDVFFSVPDGKGGSKAPHRLATWLGAFGLKLTNDPDAPKK